MSDVTRRLYKSRRDKIIDGVCGGVAEYLNMDPTIVRILWILLTFMGGSGIILYIAAMIIVPPNPAHVNLPPSERVARGRSDAAVLFGAVFIILGGLILLDNLHFVPWHFWRLSWETVIAIVLILGGLLLILRPPSTERPPVSPPTIPATEPPAGTPTEGSPVGSTAAAGEAQSETQSTFSERRLYRSSTDRKLLGVCGGLAEYLTIDPSIIRILWVVLCLASIGIGIILYIAMAIIVPEKK